MLRLTWALPLLALALPLLGGCESDPRTGDAPEASAGSRAADLPQTDALRAKSSLVPYGGAKGSRSAG